jgi:hypothetical protein
MVPKFGKRFVEPERSLGTLRTRLSFRAIVICTSPTKE